MFFKVISDCGNPPKYSIYREEFCIHKDIEYLALRLFYDDVNQCRDSDMIETHESTLWSGKDWRERLAEIDRQAFTYSY